MWPFKSKSGTTSNYIVEVIIQLIHETRIPSSTPNLGSNKIYDIIKEMYIVKISDKYDNGKVFPRTEFYYNSKDDATIIYDYYMKIYMIII